MKSSALPVLFLWHHHQPFYCGPDMPRPVMPWVRLHAIRGYWDMISVLKRTGAHVTFNFSPSLLEQLYAAASSRPADEFERISEIPAADLSESEKRFILQHFFSINWDVHIRPNSRYSALLSKRGDSLQEDNLRQALIEFTKQDFADLIALFNLLWIGFTGRSEPQLRDLIEKGRDYLQEDIRRILDFHHEILNQVISAYREQFSQERIDISISPFSHAILPLLCDTRVAAPDLPKKDLPRPEYRHPEDAERQLRAARDTFEQVWNRTASGLWPSEGSVSNEAIGIAAKCEFEWAATDQGNLERSKSSRSDNLSHFLPYDYTFEDRTIRLYFRDRALSDAIGFRYSSMHTSESVSEFVGSLERIEEATRNIQGRCVVIALDGENPWENYPDGGKSFLTEIYRAIDKHARLILQTISNHAQHSAREQINSIHSGSWIDSNFRIWIGDPSKNAAWTELGRARKLIDELSIADPRRQECNKWLMYAQGSDWFWWYGDPFRSEYKPHFDGLFRSYLKAIYHEAGSQWPPALDVPITQAPQRERRMQPMFPIAPTLDGRETSYYEWIGACRVDPLQWGATMGRSVQILQAVYYGFGEREIFLRFDPVHRADSGSNVVLNLNVLGQKQCSIGINLFEPCDLEGDGVRSVSRGIIEVAILYTRLQLLPGMECQFWIEVVDGNMILDKLPPAGAIRFIVPTSEMLSQHWIV